MAKKTQQSALNSIEIRCQSGSFATASFRMSTSGQPLDQQSQQSCAPCLSVVAHQVLCTSNVIDRPHISQRCSNTYSRVFAGGGKGRGRQEAAQPLHARTGAPVFELAAAVPAGSAQNVDLGRLLVRRPVAAIALVPKSALLFAAGAVAGALGTPPLLL